MTKTLTPEQKIALEAAKKDLIAKVMATKDTPVHYPTNPDGSKNFSAGLVEDPITEEEVTYLVGAYFAIRFNEGVGHNEAARRTYACCYRDSSTRFAPHARVAELKKEFGE